MNKRRIVRIDVSFPLLIDMMSESYYTVGPAKNIKGIPDDSIFTASTHDPARDIVSLFFSHDSFDEVLEGGLVPTKPISHEVDYVHLDLLRKWLDIIEDRINNDAVFDAVVLQHFYEVIGKTTDYLEEYNGT